MLNQQKLRTRDLRGATPSRERRRGSRVPSVTPEVWQELKTFRLRPDDVISLSYLRSGSNWMRHILRLLRNEGKDDGVNLDDAVPWLDGLRSSVGADIMRLNANLDANALPSPRYFKVHLPYELTPGGLPHTTNSKYIYIARNPKDHSVSQWHFCQTELPKLTDHVILNRGTNTSVIFWHKGYFQWCLEAGWGMSWSGGSTEMSRTSCLSSMRS